MKQDDRRSAVQMTALLSIMHMITDFLCALTMTAGVVSQTMGLNELVLYNFCAFALQMPFGIAADRLSAYDGGRERTARLTVLAGVVLTLAGCFLGPAVLGTGNALFHVGGGMITIRRDDACGFRGRGLGVFVAPGAVGLACGAILADPSKMWLPAAVLVVLVFCVLMEKGQSAGIQSIDPDVLLSRSVWISAALLSAVVVIRSAASLAMQFPWKSAPYTIILAACASALGKAAGGFVSASLGYRRAAAVSLLASAVCFIAGANMICGLAGLLFFNMTMPMTLYGLKQKMPSMPGFAFGILTFALFIGYLPAVSGLFDAVSSVVLGAGASLVSLVLLLAEGRKE
ncbi:MAG: hypothetical protein K6A40_02190 [Solobacterium sp.]|nr:hypothetical protein [Solobacterium sp.]